MSITVFLHYRGENGSARRFAEKMETSGTADRIRAEAGNLCYRYFLPLDDPETVVLIDRWTDQAAIDLHHASPMMQEIIRLREKYALHVTAERFETTEEAFPESDSSFLRK